MARLCRYIFVLFCFWMITAIILWIPFKWAVSDWDTWNSGTFLCAMWGVASIALGINVVVWSVFFGSLSSLDFGSLRESRDWVVRLLGVLLLIPAWPVLMMVFAVFAVWDYFDYDS